MEPLLQFIGSYWWLVFPLMGVTAGLGRAWERGAKRRHARRLEIIKAKGELKLAQASATPPVRARRSAAKTESRAETPTDRLQRLIDTHDQTTARWLEYELDVAKMIAYPAMSDGRQPLTAAFLRAKKVADGLRPAGAHARLTREQFAEYREAVTDYEVAFEVAERDARRVKDSGFTDAERKRLDTAKQLLTVAIDQAATPAERQLAYRRVREELDGLISLSDDAIDVLEEKVALELTAHAASDADDSAGDGSSRSTRSPGPNRGPSPAAGPPSTWPVPARTTKAPGRIIRP